MTHQRTENLPRDVEQVYRDLGIMKAEERERLQRLGEGEDCVKWQSEPPGPIFTDNGTRRTEGN